MNTDTVQLYSNCAMQSEMLSRIESSFSRLRKTKKARERAARRSEAFAQQAKQYWDRAQLVVASWSR